MSREGFVILCASLMLVSTNSSTNFSSSFIIMRFFSRALTGSINLVSIQATADSDKQAPPFIKLNTNVVIYVSGLYYFSIGTSLLITSDSSDSYILSAMASTIPLPITNGSTSSTSSFGFYSINVSLNSFFFNNPSSFSYTILQSESLYPILYSLYTYIQKQAAVIFLTKVLQQT